MSHEDGNAEFGLARSFGIDEGQLSGKSKQECFVLGYELATFDQNIREGHERFEMNFVHADNFDRMREWAEKNGYDCLRQFMPNDRSESWIKISARKK